MVSEKAFIEDFRQGSVNSINDTFNNFQRYILSSSEDNLGNEDAAAFIISAWGRKNIELLLAGGKIIFLKTIDRNNVWPSGCSEFYKKLYIYHQQEFFKLCMFCINLSNLSCN